MPSIFLQNGATSDLVTAEQNIEQKFDPILRVDPDDSTLIKLLNGVATGSRKGLPIFAQFVNLNGNKLPGNSKLRLTVDVAGQRQPLVVSEEIENIGAWNRLTVAEQQNAERIDAVKVLLEDNTGEDDQIVEAVNVRDVDELRLELKAADTFDPSQSVIVVDSDAVEEQRIRG
jgi:hypothetical protein